MKNLNKKIGYLISDNEGKIKFFGGKIKKILEINSMSKKTRIFNFFSKDKITKIIDSWININQKKINKIQSIIKNNNTNYKYLINIIPKIHNKKTYYILIINPTKLINKTNKIYEIIQKIKFIIRSKFLLGSLIPLIFSIIWSIQYIEINKINIEVIAMIIISSLSLHSAANTINDFFDWKSKADKINHDYLITNTGGSRAIELQIITPKKMLNLSIILLSISVISGFYIINKCGITVLNIGLIALFGVIFYTSPPIYLSSKRGAGELLHILCLGPLFVIGTTFCLTKYFSVNEFIIGLPIGILITSCLWANEYPDIKSDSITGKNNLVVIMGKKNFNIILFIMIISSYISIIIFVFLLNNSKLFLITFLSLPTAIKIIKKSSKLKNNFKLINNICFLTFKLYILFNLLLIIATVINNL